MAINAYGSTGASTTVKPTKTQLYCNNCRKISEWKDIKEYVWAERAGIQTMEIFPGKWAAFCPGCGMPFGGDKPRLIEGMELMRLENKSDDEIRAFIIKDKQSNKDRDAKYLAHLRGIKELMQPAPIAPHP